MQSFFDGTVLIDGGTVQVTEPAGDGVSSFSFVSGTSGTLEIEGITEPAVLNFNGGAVNYVAAAALTPVAAIFPGDVIDLDFVPYDSAGLGLFVTSSSVTVTSGGSPVVVANTTPVATSGTTLTIPIAAANAYVYSLSSDGHGGTDLTVVGTTGSGAMAMAGGTVSQGSVAATITTYNDGTLGFTEPAGSSFLFPMALPGSGLVVQSGPGTLSLYQSDIGANTLVIGGGTVDLLTAELLPTGFLPPPEGSPIEFEPGTSGTLVIDASASVYSPNVVLVPGAISGFAAGDVISASLVDVGRLPPPLGISVSGDTVTFTENGQPAGHGYSLDIVGASSLPLLFSAAADGSSFTLSVACYARGTRVLTTRGDVAVQDLAIGDHVVTVSGEEQPIRWIGRRGYGGRFLAGRRAALAPILIRAGALGGGLPRRDLRVSPTHAMLLDGVLVPARCLVNGASIVQDLGCTEVEYFHIELAQHDAIWAEGAASETFIDEDSRGLFHNAAEYRALYPDTTEEPAAPMAPRVESGYQLEAIRARLAKRARLARLA